MKRALLITSLMLVLSIIHVSGVVARDFQTIDTHLHSWDLSKVEYRRLNGLGEPLERSYLIPEIIPQMQAANVDLAVMVQAEDKFTDTVYMLDLADQYDFIVGVVGWVPLEDSEKTKKAVARFRKNTHFKGVRHLIHILDDDKWLLRENVIESLKILAGNNLSFDVVGTTLVHLQCALEVAKKIPNLRIVLDHLNQPPIKTGEFGEWGSLMKAISKQENVYVKISGLGTASGNPEGWQADDLRKYIKFVLDVFGPDRILSGGDWPVCILGGGYKKAWDAYHQIVSELVSEENQAKIFQTNAEAFYNLK